MEEGEFLAIVRENAPKGEPICLEPDTVITLTSAVKLHRHDKLIVRGGIIQGFCHSLFQIDCNSNKQIALTLENVRLNHTMVHEDRRQVGAAVFVMSKAVVSLIGCTFTSTAGFGIWAKHDSSITVKDCSIVRHLKNHHLPFSMCLCLGQSWKKCYCMFQQCKDISRGHNDQTCFCSRSMFAWEKYYHSEPCNCIRLQGAGSLCLSTRDIGNVRLSSISNHGSGIPSCSC
eukprot:m.68033 g.68033  ORF g.68033 m.68033 type:complete len:230 (+) comp11934_c0_seq1:37-726(+)